MNPFREAEVLRISQLFYERYYSDTAERQLILGINPGRFGAGVTGIPFTDPKRLAEKCNLAFPGKITHEPSSVFVYDVIDAFGGVTHFYNKFYVNSVCPLGFVIIENGKEKNYNYYDSKELEACVKDFIVESIRKQIALGVSKNICFCLGVKNGDFLTQLNQEYHFFKKIVVLEHPRWVMQYNLKKKQIYIDKYVSALKQTL
jgi:hypothetical protein